MIFMLIGRLARIMSQIERIESITSRCLEIADELISLHQFVTFEKVIDVLLNRYSVPHFQALGFSSPWDVPVLKYLYDINHTIQSYISAYISTSPVYSSIQTVADLDQELYSFLESLNFPALVAFRTPSSSVHTTATVVVVDDPNSINIDENEEEDTGANQNMKMKEGEVCESRVNNQSDESSITGRLDYFGLGSIHYHPLIKYHFQLSDQYVHFYTVLSTDILSLWTQYLASSNQVMPSSFSSSSSSSSFPTSCSSFQLSAFISHILKIYGVDNLHQLGVRVYGDFGPEFQSLSHVVNAHHKRWVEFQKRELSQLQQSVATSTQSSQSKRRKNSPEYAGLVDDTPMMNELNNSCSDSVPVDTPTAFQDISEAPIINPRNKTEVDDVPYEGRLFSQGQGKAIRICAPSSRSDGVTLLESSTAVSSILLSGRDEGDGEDSLVTVDSSLLQPLTQCMTQYVDFASPGLLQQQTQTQSSGGSDVASKMKQVGRWGEALVYHFLVSAAAAATSAVSTDNHKSNTTVEWLNQVEETKACYDLIVTRTDHASGRARRQYIEVKSTRFNDTNVFELSLREYEFAMGLPRVHYSIYRVFNAGNIKNAHIVVIPDVYSFITQQKVKLCVAL